MKKVVLSTLFLILIVSSMLIYFSYYIYAEKNNTSEIIEKQDINKVYYAKVDSKQDYFKNLEEKGIKIELSKINYSKIILGKNITAEQELTLNFNNSKYKNNTYNKLFLKIDLYMHVKKELLKNLKEIKIYDEKNNLISETPFLILNDNSFNNNNINNTNNTKNTEEILKFKIKYKIKPIEEKTFCERKTIKDIIPKEAYNINSNLNLNETIKEECKIILKHDLIKEFLEQKIYFDINENKEIEKFLENNQKNEQNEQNKENKKKQEDNREMKEKILAKYQNKTISLTIKKENNNIVISQ